MRKYMRTLQPDYYPILLKSHYPVLYLSHELMAFKNIYDCITWCYSLKYVPLNSL